MPPSNGASVPALIAPPAPVAYAPAPDWRWDQNRSHRASALLPIYAMTFVLPRPVALRAADAVATVCAHTFRETRRVLGGNFRRLDPALPDAALGRLVDATMRNWGRCVVDAMYLARARPAHVRRLIAALEGGDILDAALARGRGVVLMSPHLGHPELGGAVLAMHGYTLNIVTVVVPDARVRRMKQDFRERFGIRHLYLEAGDRAPQAMLGILDALRRNEIVAMIPDRASASEHATVAFAGDRARFPIGPARVAIRTGAALLPAYVVRDGGSRYRAVIEPEVAVPLADPADRDAAALAVTQEVAHRFEAIVRRFPDQWYNFFPSWVSRDGGTDAVAPNP